ncbi:hypothetical protein K505DRAFT_209478, partial [Melanomma pulvis-pyrius CBS 109.77]
YFHVSVLIIRWHEHIGDMPGYSEDARLQTIILDLFHYDFDVFKLDNAKKPWNQLNFALANFMHQYDGPDNLLIVYCTGNGVL